jgi:hypothetical protein
MVPLMFAALRQRSDSREFLSYAQNKEFFATKNKTNKTMCYIAECFDLNKYNENHTPFLSLKNAHVSTMYYGW